MADINKLNLLWIIALFIPFAYAVECTEGQQPFDNVCYPCENGQLSFNSNDRSIVCTNCVEGFKMENNQCVPETMTAPRSDINAKIDNVAVMVSGWFGDTNPMIGFIILGIVFFIVLYYVLNYFGVI